MFDRDACASRRRCSRGGRRVLVAFVAARAAASAPPGCANRTNNDLAKLLECVTLEGVRAHQAAFQEIADDNEDPFYPGTRAAGTEGYAKSVDYVAGLLEDAGYEVTLEPVPVPSSTSRQTLPQQLTPVQRRHTRQGRSRAAAQATVMRAGDPGRHQSRPRRGRARAAARRPTSLGLDWSGEQTSRSIQRGTCTFA